MAFPIRLRTNTTSVTQTVLRPEQSTTWQMSRRSYQDSVNTERSEVRRKGMTYRLETTTQAGTGCIVDVSGDALDACTAG
jgi:hypothetical protein